MDKMPHGQYYQNRYNNDTMYSQQYGNSQQYSQQIGNPQQYSQQYGAQPQYTQNYYQPPITAESLPENLRPLSPWAYIGYGILMGIPLVGFICMLVFSFSSSGNINRRNYARSFLYLMIIGVVLTIAAAVIMAALGVNISNMRYY
ncbi:MAG: hypothetical protein IJ788_05620 [Oscillospiraceae bacterium]|nr:hypothetical protein [Oscillospiraceae bacterium]